jgi:hypothetical protein
LQDPPANKQLPAKVSPCGYEKWQVSMTATFVLDSKLLTDLYITRNFCTHRWFKQLVPHGSSHEFKGYWDSLGKERQQVSSHGCFLFARANYLTPEIRCRDNKTSERLLTCSTFLRAFSSF